VVVFSNSATKVKNGEQLIDCFTAIGVARGAVRSCLPNQTALPGLVVFFQWEFGNGLPVLIHYGH
jgi:hypothetical protein